MSDALIDAAIIQFGEYGPEGASTRAIAAAAGVAMSTITYRHGGKDGLYLAAADHIARTISERISPALDADIADPVDHAVAILRTFAALMLSDQTEAWSRFIVREQMHPTPAFDRLWDGVMGRALDRLAAMVRRALGETDLAVARLTAISLMGQALVFRAGRAAVMRAMEIDAFGPDDITAVLDRIERNTRRMLTP